MGYYTQYELNFWRKDLAGFEDKKDFTATALMVMDALCDINPGEFNKQRISTKLKPEDVIDLDGINLLLFPEETKWYASDEDMIELSKRFPGVVFQLSGAGEGYGDLWRLFFSNGKQTGGPAKIVYPEFGDSCHEL